MPPRSSEILFRKLCCPAFVSSLCTQCFRIFVRGALGLAMVGKRTAGTGEFGFEAVFRFQRKAEDLGFSVASEASEYSRQMGFIPHHIHIAAPVERLSRAEKRHS
ncbi:uncharacterized protein BJX67DRAFT_40297 [Aspergillus lucknowensis]|uniref:Uncharacterized protein n=1 Tax=Aspergillus lucknowensis TaxID=176173 RepID=A0ABR4LWG2_9EURO